MHLYYKVAATAPRNCFPHYICTTEWSVLRPAPEAVSLRYQASVQTSFPNCQGMISTLSESTKIAILADTCHENTASKQQPETQILLSQPHPLRQHGPQIAKTILWTIRRGTLLSGASTRNSKRTGQEARRSSNAERHPAAAPTSNAHRTSTHGHTSQARTRKLLQNLLQNLLRNLPRTCSSCSGTSSGTGSGPAPDLSPISEPPKLRCWGKIVGIELAKGPVSASWYSLIWSPAL